MTSPLDSAALTIPKIDAAAAARGAGTISFAGGTPHPGDLPLSELSEALRDSLSPEALAYGPARGEPELLAALRDRLGREGVDAAPERTMVTTGAMAGLDLLFRRHLAPGEMAVVESPTYSDALISLALAGAQVAELPIDADGARVDALPALAAEAGPPRLIYTIPTFHNPTGTTMSEERRHRLVALAAELGALLVEDDAYGDFRFGGEPLPSLASLSPDVVAVRSLSKVVAPGLRLGCTVGPPELIARLEQVRGGTDICTGALAQRAAARFLREGRVDAHVRRLTERFEARRDAMLAALKHHFADLDAEWSVPQGGMFLWVRLGGGPDTTQLLEPALAEGVSFVPGSLFSAHGNHRYALRLCFGAVEEGEIEEGVARLRAALRQLPGVRGR